MDKLFGALIVAFIVLFFSFFSWSVYKHIQYENSLVAIKTERRTLTLTHVNYPKHFDVNGIDNTGVEWQSVGNSKHCNRARAHVRTGQRYPIEITTYRDRDGLVFSRLNDYRLNQEMCGI